MSRRTQASATKTLITHSQNNHFMFNTGKNTWSAKIARFFTSFLPIDKKRAGECKQCGACCKLPNVCPFLGYDEYGKSKCSVYPLRSFACRKYPRTDKEHLTKDICGFSFRK